MPPTPQPRSTASPWVKAPASLVFSLPPELLATYLRIRYYDRGQGCWASMATIGAGVVSDRQARRHVRELERRGLLRVVARDGQSHLLFCVEPDGDTPVMSVQGRRSRMATVEGGNPGHPCPANKIHEPQEDPMKHNQGADPASHMSATGGTVVVPDEGGELLPLRLPDDLAELPRKRKGLSMATIRKLVGEHGIETVRQAVGVVNQQYPDDAKVRSFGALLSAAVRDGWRSSTTDAQADQEARASAIAMATPPAGTTWAKLREGGSCVEVVEVTGEVVRTTTGVIPRHMWPEWEWITDSDPQSINQDDQEGRRNLRQVSQHPPAAGEAPDKPCGWDERRRHLARFAARCSSVIPMTLRRTPQQLAPDLERVGLAVGDLVVYLAEQEQRVLAGVGV